MKQFVFKLLLLTIPVVLFFTVPVTKYIRGEFFGDISNMSGYTFPSSYRDVFSYDPHFQRHVIITEDYPSCAVDSSVLILGDSFTQQGRRTFLEYLQNEMPNWTVYNVQTATDFKDWFYIQKSQHDDTSQLLLFRSMPDFVIYTVKYAKVLPHTIVLESTESLFLHRMLEARFDISGSDIELYDSCGIIHKARLPQEGPFRLEGTIAEQMSASLSTAQRWIRHLPSTFIGKNRFTLDRPLFSCEGMETSLFVSDMGCYRFTHEELVQAKKNAVRMVEMAKDRGVDLIISIVPDKMQLYRDYVVNLPSRYRNPCLSDSLMDWTGNPHYLVNRPYLRQAIEKGEKDIFLCNDIHWSYKAAAISAKALKLNIQKLNSQN